MSLKAIAFGWTGTMSMKVALGHLCFDPCKNKTEVMKNAAPSTAGAAGAEPNWATLFEAYDEQKVGRLRSDSTKPNLIKHKHFAR